MARFENTRFSAWNIVNSLPFNPVALRIQEEMVDEGKFLLDTAAGRSMSSWFLRSSDILKNLIQRFELLIQGITASSDLNASNKRKQQREMGESIDRARAGLKMIEAQQFFRKGSLVEGVAKRKR